MNSKRVLYAGVGFLFIVGILFVLQYTPLLLSKESPQPELSDYELGQYYFNHDDDPAGPYDLKKARYYYEKVILSDPKDNALVWHQLGRIDFLEGDFDAALYKFGKQFEYFGNLIYNTYYMVGLTYAYKARETNDEADWTGAEIAFKNFLNFEPNNPWARTDLSWIYFAQGKYADMYVLLNHEVENHPDHPWILNMYGLALRNIGRKEEAKEYFTRAAKLAENMTEEDWGKAYPGNNPKYWQDGLEEFRDAIEHNDSL